MALKTTTEKCFSNGSEFMFWLECNCYKCRKNSTIDKDGNEKFHCVIQADLFWQSVCGDEVRQISYDAAQQVRCPRLRKRGDAPKYHRRKKDPANQTTLNF